MGHIRMMGAIQPFLSGAISKTVNMPEAASAEEIEQVYLEGWRLGLKAIAVYRDNSKRSQPLMAGKKDAEGAATPDSEVVEKLRRQLAAAQAEAAKPHRRRLPAERTAVTHKFQIAGHEGYITVGLYEDGKPGELFLKMAKEGSTISGLMDTIATMTSVSLQYGVPLRDLVNKFAHVRFEPAGFTGNPEIPIAKSIVDYVFRWMGSRFLPAEERAALGLISQEAQQMTMPFAAPAAASTPMPPEAPAPLAVSASASVDTASADPVSITEPTTAFAPAAAGTSSPAAATPLPVLVGAAAAAANGNGHANGNGNGSGTGLSAFSASLGATTKVSFSVSADSPSCADCGSIMVRNGSCYKCLNCGSTSGCS
jgi:ribonucleoside-diphosphate reductase alpha chain